MSCVHVVGEMWQSWLICCFFLCVAPWPTAYDLPEVTSDKNPNFSVAKPTFSPYCVFAKKSQYLPVVQQWQPAAGLLTQVESWHSRGIVGSLLSLLNTTFWTELFQQHWHVKPHTFPQTGKLSPFCRSDCFNWIKTFSEQLKHLPSFQFLSLYWQDGSLIWSLQKEKVLYFKPVLTITLKFLNHCFLC